MCIKLWSPFKFSAVFTWISLLVVVVELDGNKNQALDLVPLVTNTVLEEHYLIVGVVVVVDLGIILINSRGKKTENAFMRQFPSHSVKFTSLATCKFHERHDEKWSSSCQLFFKREVSICWQVQYDTKCLLG